MSPQELDEFLNRLAQRQDQFQTLLNNMAATFAEQYARIRQENDSEHRRIRAELRDMRREGLRIIRELAEAHLSLENKMEQLEDALENFLRRSGNGGRPAS